MLNFEQLYLLLESSSTHNLMNVLYIVGDQYTQGRHSFGDEEEEPASDPSKLIKPEFVYEKNDILKIIQNNNASIQQVFFERYEWGSYHERNLSCEVSLLIKEPDVYEDLEKLHDELEKHLNEHVYSTFSEFQRNRSGYETKTVEFTNLDDVLLQWEEFAKTSDIKTPETSSEEYWDKKIRNTMMKYKHDRGMYEGD